MISRGDHFPGAGLGPIRKTWIAYDEVIPLQRLSFRVRVDAAVERVYMAPDQQDMAFEAADGAVSFTVERLLDAATVCIELGEG